MKILTGFFTFILKPYKLHIHPFLTKPYFAHIFKDDTALLCFADKIISKHLDA